MALTVLSQWLAFRQLQGRTLGVVDRRLASEFLLAAAVGVARDAAILLVGNLLIAGTLEQLRLAREPRRLFAVMLVASIPLALWALGRCLALASGSQLDAWVMPTGGSAARDVAATLEEAIPTLGPLVGARSVAVGLSAAFVVVLHRRLCGARMATALVSALGYGGLMLLTRFSG